ncbi:MAG: ankyrin repeat domain-containing protein [Calothrix sp. SM1_7_51]|nr:ankyrin repeat domain-containing protein [Calothrix sp. SM1_7_51]
MLTNIYFQSDIFAVDKISSKKFTKYSYKQRQKQLSSLEDQIIEAILKDNIQVVKKYFDQGGNPNQFFSLAVSNGSMKSVKLMLSRGVNVNSFDKRGYTPLMIAAQYTYRAGSSMTEFLLSKGAQVNAKTSRGTTPLMFASWAVGSHHENEYVKVIRMLIAKGAKVNTKNQIGETPLSIAKKGNWKKIIAVLNKAGAK